MNKLKECLTAFKIRWQKEKAASPVRSELDDLIQMYSQTKAEGSEEIKQRFSERWAQLSETKQDELVSSLIEYGILSYKVKFLIEEFNGRVVKLV